MWTLTRVILRGWFSLGRGMGLYLRISLVGFKVSKYSYDDFTCWWSFMMLVSLMNMLLVYISKYDDDYYWCDVMLSWALHVIFCLVYLIEKGYGALLGHCTCRINGGSWLMVLVILWCDELLYMLIWLLVVDVGLVSYVGSTYVLCDYWLIWVLDCA